MIEGKSIICSFFFNKNYSIKNGRILTIYNKKNYVLGRLLSLKVWVIIFLFYSYLSYP